MTKKTFNEYQPDIVTPPGETLQDMLDSLGMTKAELADRIGKTPKHIGEIIKHTAQITPATAMELEKVLGTPASFWNNRERRYRESLARNEEKNKLKKESPLLNKFPVRDMINAGWLPEFKDITEQTGALLQYFGVASFRQWEKLWRSPETAYRKSKTFSSNPEACSVWLRKGEIEAQQIDCQPYNKEKFKAILLEIKSLTCTAPEKIQMKTVELCAQAGVAVVFVPPVKGVSVYGATRWLTPKKALLLLSLRGKYEDLLWFTFFHEAGHILLHGKKEVFIENTGMRDQQENEANSFASSFLIQPAAWKKLIAGNFRTKEFVKRFAEKIGISPAIVVGRLQYEKRIPYSHMNDLRRQFELP
ncbi:MAG: XRE family transcriptional regulator [Desulfobacterium sp.]|nr:XRE family transcriptional regulator [Desulfobacterium sp.]